MGRLSGKTVIITGAGSGIGRAASLLFAAEGAKLVIADKFDTVEETARQVREAGGTALALTGDAGEEAFVSALVDRAVAEHGVLDAIWANAGISGGATPREDQDAAHWAEVLRVNLIGPFLAVKHASRVPQQPGQHPRLELLEGGARAHIAALLKHAREARGMEELHVGAHRVHVWVP